jgi:hypothetical protein
MNGVVNEKIARDHMSPLGRNNIKWTTPAPIATKRANRIRPALEFGVVLGSEIIKKVKRRNAPFWRM